MLTISDIHSIERHRAKLEKMREDIDTILKNLPADAPQRVWLNSAIISNTDAIRALNFAVAK